MTPFLPRTYRNTLRFVHFSQVLQSPNLLRLAQFYRLSSTGTVIRLFWRLSNELCKHSRFYLISIRAVSPHAVACLVQLLHHRRLLLLMQARYVPMSTRLRLAFASPLRRFWGTSTGSYLSASRFRVLSSRTIPRSKRYSVLVLETICTNCIHILVVMILTYKQSISTCTTPSPKPWPPGLNSCHCCFDPFFRSPMAVVSGV